jgi:hypothetical protein
MFKHKRVAIDFDGTLFEDISDTNLAFEQELELVPMPNADFVTAWLKSLDFEILIFTCRPDYHRKYMERLLDKAGISFDYILFYTKPRVDLYIDDKGFRFKDWDTTKSFIEKKLHESGDLAIVSQSPNQVFESALRDERLRVFETCISSLQNPIILDYGCGEGNTNWGSLNAVIVDGFDVDKKLLKTAEGKKRYRRIYYDEPSLQDYDVVVLMGVLEHVEDDVDFLKNFKETKHIFATVPNAGSFHRRVGLELGLLSTLNELGAHDLSVGHQRYYDEGLFSQLSIAALGATHHLAKFGSLSVKFGSNAQMATFHDVAPIMNRIAEQTGLSGHQNFFGAELFAHWEKK